MELFAAVNSMHVSMLILGSITYSLLSLYPLLKRSEGFQIAYWLRRNLLPHGVATALGYAFLVFISNVPVVIEKMDQSDLETVAYLLGLSSDFAVYQVKKMVLSNNKSNDS